MPNPLGSIERPSGRLQSTSDSMPLRNRKPIPSAKKYSSAFERTDFAMTYAFDRRQFLRSSFTGLGTCALMGGCGGAASVTVGAAVATTPEPVPLPLWVPARGDAIRTVATKNSFLSQNGNLPGWEQAFGKIVDDFSGGVFNPYWGPMGAMVFHGGGHAATFDNSVVVLDMNDLTFKRLSDPTPSKEGKNWLFTTGDTQGLDPAFDPLHCEYGDGQPGAGHSYDTLAIVPPSDGGAPLGSLVRVASFAVHVNASANTGWAHRFDFTSTTMRDGQWTRWSVNGPPNHLFPGACSAYDSIRKRIWWIAGLSSAPRFVRYLDVATRQQREIGFASASGLAPTADPDSTTLRHHARLDILVLTCTVQQKVVLAFLRCGQAEQGWTLAPLSQTIAANVGSAHGFDWVPESGKFVLLTDADNASLYDITPPAVLGSAWSVVRRPLAAAAIPNARVIGKRWSYVPALQSFIWMASSTSAVVAYRP
jgi:hypothetical protein